MLTARSGLELPVPDDVQRRPKSRIEPRAHPGRPDYRGADALLETDEPLAVAAMHRVAWPFTEEGHRVGSGRGVFECGGSGELTGPYVQAHADSFCKGVLRLPDPDPPAPRGSPRPRGGVFPNPHSGTFPDTPEPRASRDRALRGP